MLYVTDILLGDSFITISYHYDASTTSHPYGDTTADEDYVDFWINEFTFDDLVVEIDDAILLDYIEEQVLAGHQAVVTAEEEARYAP